MDRISQLEQMIFVKQMGELSENSFKDVFDSNQDFVDFTQASMTQGKGIFQFWLEYVKLRTSNNA